MTLSTVKLINFKNNILFLFKIYFRELIINYFEIKKNNPNTQIGYEMAICHEVNLTYFI